MNNRFIRIFCLLLTVCILTVSLSLGESSMDITTTVLDQFMELTKIPRPSGHEESVSDYLKHWAEGRNFTVIQDSYHNIIFDVPASKGYEALPLTALQCHMDMVFAQKEGLNLDPLTTVISAVNDGTWLKTDGSTSLGADDGIGIALILCIADGKADHGPLRLIITTDEETSMSGTNNMDPSLLTGVRYLINVDSETEGELCVSSACGDKAYFTKGFEAAHQSKEKTVQIRLHGLSGGHSGLAIGKNLLNAGMEMGSILNTILNADIDFELKSLKGGLADNAIMNSVTAVICIDEADSVALSAIIDSRREQLKEAGSETDPELKLDISDATAEDDAVLPASERDAVLTFFTEYKNGVKTMSPSIPGLVESSSNLGIVEISPESIRFAVMSRSSNADREAGQLNEQQTLADKLEYNIEIINTGDAWDYKPDSKLERHFREAYQDLFGTGLSIVAVHAGLECGTYAKYNPDMDIVSVGPTVVDAHSVNEKLEISSIRKVWDLLTTVLVQID